MSSEPVAAPDNEPNTSVTTSTTNETSSNSGSNGKRDRPDDDDNNNGEDTTSEAPAKVLRSSDDSDERESLESVDVKTAINKDKTSNNAKKDAMADTTENTAPTVEDVSIRIDRTGNETNNPSSETPAPATASTPTMGNSGPPPNDPRAGNNTSIPAQKNDTAQPLGAPTDTTGESSAANLLRPMNPNVQATVTNPDQMVEERGEVSAMYVGRVIGKGGEMIRDLQARSGARIDVDQNVPPGQPRVITYRGTRETVDFAKQLVQMLSVQGVHENDLPLGKAAQEILIIPSQAVGKVIGRGGEMIRELQSRSHGKIQIDHTGQSGLPPDQKQVTITGTQEAVTKAKEMVLFLVANPMMDAQQSLNMLVDDKTRGGGQWGSGPPYFNLPNQGVNMQPHQVPPQYQQVNQGYGNYGFQQQQQQPQAPSFGAPFFPPGGTPYGGPGGPGGRETDMIYASKQFMGRIIGTKGVTVNDVQRRSACDIQINQDVPPGQDCEITLKGNRQSIEAAKAMIKDIIEIGPHHPYAGGMDTYGPPPGGGGGAGGGLGGGGYHGSFPQQQQQNQPPPQFSYQPGFDQYGGQAAFMQPQLGYGQGPSHMGGYQQQQPPQQQQAQQYGGYQQQMQPQHQSHRPPPMAPPPHQVQPSAWKTATSADGQIYYYNEQTGETQWDKPAGMP